MTRLLMGLLAFNVMAAVYVLMSAPTVAPPDLVQNWNSVHAEIGSLSTAEYSREEINAVMEIHYQLGRIKDVSDHSYSAYKRIEGPTLLMSLVNIAALAFLVFQARKTRQVKQRPALDESVTREA